MHEGTDFTVKSTVIILQCRIIENLITKTLNDHTLVGHQRKMVR